MVKKTDPIKNQSFFIYDRYSFSIVKRLISILVYLNTGVNTSLQVVKQWIVYSQQVYLHPQYEVGNIPSLQSVWYLNITIHWYQQVCHAPPHHQ